RRHTRCRSDWSSDVCSSDLASPDTRAQRVSERAGIDVGKAKRVVSGADAGRRDYLKRFYDIDHELPTHYDLVLNTDALSVEDAEIGRASCRERVEAAEARRG